ncbi:MAG: T9SS type B sorting domain-containing protein, partial [Paludibacteraceae bacterium]|nr:T9SS type B sorting domain-containing protein [Paludibacteraceae bacterium]
VDVNPLPSFAIDTTQMETITVILNDERFAPYTFDLDGAGVHQTSPEFERPQEGPHTMLVTDALGCETEEPFWLDPKIVDIIIPPFFTPDGDGVNDIWRIGNIEHYPDAVIKIYDRFHKLIVEMDGTAEGWDGTYRGHPEPSTDYWYYIKIQELGKPRTGHITLKRLKEHD